MSRRFISKFLGNSNASAGAEMALMMPILFALIFTTFEGGNYMWTEHKVLKGVRDGARYAARLPFDYYSCTSPTLVTPTGIVTAATSDSPATRETQIKNLTRTGQISGGGPKVSGWSDAQIDVTVSCNATYNQGLYSSVSGGAPVVTVRINDNGVPYPSILGLLGFDTSDLVVRARASAAVTGL